MCAGIERRRRGTAWTEYRLKNASKPADQNTAFFFLKIVRARESDYARAESYFMRKMRAFQEYAQQKKDEARWEIGNFLVSVVPTRERAANRCRKVGENGLAFKRFWFTDFGRYSLDSPADILGKIFTTPRDYRQGVLLQLSGLIPE